MWVEDRWTAPDYNGEDTAEGNEWVRGRGIRGTTCGVSWTVVYDGSK